MADSWFDRQQLQDLNRCGANCLQFCECFLSGSSRRADIDRLLPPTGDMIDMKSIRDAAEKLGMRTLALRWSEVPDPLSGPAIVRTVQMDGKSHFIVLVSRRGDGVLVADVPHDPYWVDIHTFKLNFGWNGYVLHLRRNLFELLPILVRVYRRELIGSIAVAVVVVPIGIRVFRKSFARH